MSSIRRLVFWVLMVAMPIQALAAPGWLCANAAHHPGPVPHHVQGIDEAPGLETFPGGSTNHSHEALTLSDQADTEQSTPQLPGVGKCSACSGCCFSAVAVPTAILSAPLVDKAHELVAYATPAIAVRAGDGPFRPPRTLTF